MVIPADTRERPAFVFERYSRDPTGIRFGIYPISVFDVRTTIDTTFNYKFSTNVRVFVVNIERFVSISKRAGS